MLIKGWESSPHGQKQDVKQPWDQSRALISSDCDGSATVTQTPVWCFGDVTHYPQKSAKCFHLHNQMWSNRFTSLRPDGEAWCVSSSSHPPITGLFLKRCLNNTVSDVSGQMQLVCLCATTTHRLLQISRVWMVSSESFPCNIGVTVLGTLRSDVTTHTRSKK